MRHRIILHSLGQASLAPAVGHFIMEIAEMVVREVEDIETCVREGRAPQGEGPYVVKIGGPDMTFERYQIDDPIVTGRQLLNVTAVRPVEDYALFQVLPQGGLELIRLGETVDLRAGGRERFIAFKADTLYRFVLNGESFEWGAPEIGISALEIVGDIDPETHGIWWERVDEPDQLLEENDRVDLTIAGVERFRTGPVFWVCIEDAKFRWLRETITTEEIATLGGWNASQGVIEVDADQNERTLSPGEVITLKPGLAFGKKLCWKRGLVTGGRIDLEVALLRLHYGCVEYKEANSLHWFRVEPIITPPDWSPGTIPVVFSVTQGHPGTVPYGFYVPVNLERKGAPPSEHRAPHQPPFAGQWRFLSWQAIDWRPTAEVATGDNLWGWVRSFPQRLREGQ